MIPATEDELSCLSHNGSYARLVCLNDVKARLYLPVTIFLSVLIVVGTVGNATVCLVYWRRRSSRVSSNYFILSLAVLDLVTCVVGMPTEIADLLLPYTFEWPLACKILRVVHSSTIIASSTILIEVAFDRYYRICQLGRQFTAMKAKLLCVGAVILGVICSWPCFVLFGRKTVTRDLHGVLLTGSDCSTADNMRSTIYPTIYYVFLFLLFGLTVTFFAVLYSRIGLAVLQRKRVSIGSLKTSGSALQSKREFNGETAVDGLNTGKIGGGKITINIIDVSSSEMSSEHHQQLPEVDNTNINNSRSNLLNRHVVKRNESQNRDLKNAMGRSVSATTILSNLSDSLKRRSRHRQSGLKSWYTIEPSPVTPANENVYNATSNMRNFASADARINGGNVESEEGEVKEGVIPPCGDIRSRAATLDGVIRSAHLLNVESYRARCRSNENSRDRLNNGSHSRAPRHRCDDSEVRSQSDTNGLNQRADDDGNRGDGLLESLQKFNEAFDRTFNMQRVSLSCDDVFSSAFRSTRKNQSDENGNDKTDNIDSIELNKEDFVLGAYDSTLDSGDPESNQVCPEEGKRLNASRSLLADNPLSPGTDFKQINGCTKNFISRLNVCLSHSISSSREGEYVKAKCPLGSCRDEDDTAEELFTGCGFGVRRDVDTIEDRSTADIYLSKSCSDIVIVSDEACVNVNDEEEIIASKKAQFRKKYQPSNSAVTGKNTSLLFPEYLTPESNFRGLNSTPATLTVTNPSPTQHKQPTSPSIQRQHSRQVRVGKTTTVLFAVTLAYILSFLPYLTVMVLRSVIKDLEENLSPVGELAYKLCVKSFFINNAINPLIYSFLNQTFRADARQMFRSLASSCGFGGIGRNWTTRSDSGSGSGVGKILQGPRVRVDSLAPGST